MTISEHYLQAFDRDLWSDYADVRAGLARLRSEDPAAFARAKERAWDLRDAKVAVAAADILLEAGELGDWDALKGGAALLAYDRPEEALRFLTHPAAASMNAKFVLHRARALAAAGRLAEAQSVLDQALPGLPGLQAGAELLDRVREALSLEAKARAAPGWTATRELLDAYLGLRARRPAAALCASALSLAPVWTKPGFNDMRMVLDHGLWLGADAEAVARFLEAASELEPANSFIRTEAAAADLLRGRPDLARSRPGGRKLRTNGRWLLYKGLAQEAVGELEAATQGLGRLAADHPDDKDVLQSLARCIGTLQLSRTPVRFARHRKIFDVFPFYNELTLLKIRLDEMADWVDHFVLVEASESFAGAPKPLHYELNAEAFAPYRSKIIHVKVDFPEGLTGHWAREFHQRDCAIRALCGLMAEDDLVLITDVDEIIRRDAVWAFDGDFASLRMPRFRFFLNYKALAEGDHPTGAVWKARGLASIGLSYARTALSRQGRERPRILDAGWHFSSVGHAEQVAAKYRNYAHQGGSGELRSEGYVEGLLRDIRAGRLEPGWARCEVDESFPAYVRRHARDLSDILL